MAFDKTPVHRDIDYMECTTEFKIKGDNSVNDTEIQYKLLDFQYGLSLQSRQLRMENYTSSYRLIKQINNKNKNV